MFYSKPNSQNELNLSIVITSVYIVYKPQTIYNVDTCS